MAEAIERELGLSSAVLCRLQIQYDEDIKRLAASPLMQEDITRLSEIPSGELARVGWIRDVGSDVERVLELRAHYDVESLADVEGARYAAAFRITAGTRVSSWALAAWLQQGEWQAAESRFGDGPEAISVFDRERFASLLPRMLRLTRTLDFWVNAQTLCAQAGVLLEFVPHLPKSGANGAARWLEGGRPLIQLSVLRKHADIFWFSFFHEAAHVLRGDRDVVYIDIDGAPREDEAEQAADRFAADMLIPPQRWAAFTSMGRFDKRTITQFAEAEEIHPGIVVGRLQKEQLLRYDQHNDLRMTLSDAVFVD